MEGCEKPQARWSIDVANGIVQDVVVGDSSACALGDETCTVDACSEDRLDVVYASGRDHNGSVTSGAEATAQPSYTATIQRA